jgi:hypothetical protein
LKQLSIVSLEGSRVKKHVLTFVKYGLGLGLLAWVIWAHWDMTDDSGKPIGLSEALRHDVRWLPLVLAGVICLASVLLTFVRWYVLVRAQELPFTLSSAMRLGLVGYFFNTMLPGSVGGDIIKATFVAREQSRRTVAVATVLLDRAVGLCGLFWLAALLGGLFWWGGYLADQPVLETIVVGASIVVASSIGFWLLLGVLPSRRAEIFAGRLSRIPKIGGALAEFWRAVWMYRCRGRHVGLAMLLAMIGHAGFVLTFFFAARTLTPAEDMPSLGAHYLLVPVGMTIQAGFPAPGGMGGAEYGYGKLYQIVGFAFAAGVLGSLTKRAIEWVLGLLCYLAYLRMKPQLAAPPAPVSEPAPAPAEPARTA